MVRTQVQLPEGDLRELQRMAKEEHVSVSELVRRGVRCVIEQQGKPSQDELWERASRLVGKFRSGVRDLGEGHDGYFAEAVADERLP